MRNTGWYIPYWRKPNSKKKGKAEKSSAGANTSASLGEVWRSDEQLEAVRQRWVERYRRVARAYGALGLSVGSNRAEVQSRYDLLRQRGVTRDIEDAYRYLLRVLPPMERRKKRPQEPGLSNANGAMRSSLSILEARETMVSTEGPDESVISVDLYVAKVDMRFDDGDDSTEAAFDDDFEADDELAIDDDVDDTSGA